MLDSSISELFSAGPGYLNTASVGLPPKRALEALRSRIEEWEAGAADPSSFDPDVDRARAAYADISGTTIQRVGIVGQVSVASGLVASSLPCGATVLLAEEDFTSVLFPFLVDGRLEVRTVPLHRLIESIGSSVDLVAVSAVQSADGRVIDLEALASAAHDAGARTYVDVTQAAGWLPFDSEMFDVTACGGYKWLCAARGSGFMTVGEDSSWLVPRNAGWYAGDDVWGAIYGPPLRLAGDARRFDVSPAWFDFVTAAESVELLADVGIDGIYEHNLTLANALLSHLGLPPSNSAIVSLDTPHGRALEAAGISAARRAGKVRLSFHLYNTMEDVDLAASLLAVG
ncbi:MAG TPA: aminotransferase class V-fold PLP-dependent enzyme [Acidimicrobiia bacterium]|jgi:selenocysteine lyase/cysteine desulfurase|nr:aminotransferase class V-fold PLP-dependent enzyme [Acidimicrobiia bacterium]